MGKSPGSRCVPTVAVREHGPEANGGVCRRGSRRVLPMWRGPATDTSEACGCGVTRPVGGRVGPPKHWRRFLFEA